VIFIGLFLFIVLIVVMLNMHNSSNLSEIENHLKMNNCKNYIYSRGSYKALCKDKILEVENSFTVDLKKNSTEYKYSNIKNIDIEKFDIVINNEYRLNFKQKEELDKFYMQLEDKLNN
jgi:hypothetical protein